MSRFPIFVIRAVLGLAFAVLLARLFFSRIEPLAVAGLAVFLVGMSYVSAYFRKRNSRP